jgi:hypothetical protein
MGRPGILDNQRAAEDTLLQQNNALGSTLIATIVVGTVLATGLSGGFKGGTIAGAAVLVSRKFSVIQDAEVISVPVQAGSVISGKVIGFGRTLGTLLGTTGTLMSTILPATNNILVQFYDISTVAAGQLPPVAIADASRLTGSVVAVITGK